MDLLDFKFRVRRPGVDLLRLFLEPQPLRGFHRDVQPDVSVNRHEVFLYPVGTVQGVIFARIPIRTDLQLEAMM